MADKIQTAYEASKNIYDDVLTQGNFFSRLYIKLFWSGTDDREIARKVLSYIPNDFAGALLDVPVGTAVFTERKWARLTRARITCLDYSTDMLAQAEKRLGGYAHIQCVQGDVGNLPMADEAFDTVVSMNGFHAFPDKQKAFQETWRVLKPGGVLLNFDANWYRYLWDEGAQLAHAQDRKNLQSADVRDETAGTDVSAMEAIARQAPLSAHQRPAWDLRVLRGLGMQAAADTEIWKQVWTKEERINNASTPMFLVEGRKCPLLQ